MPSRIEELRVFDERARKLAGVRRRLRLRTEDRRASRRVGLSGRRLVARRNARRRAHRRRRYAESQNRSRAFRYACAPRERRCRRCSRRAAKCILRKSDFERLNARTRSARSAGLRQSAQRGIGRRAATRSGADRATAALVFRISTRARERRRGAASTQWAALERLRELGLSRQPARRARAIVRRRRGVL